MRIARALNGFVLAIAAHIAFTPPLAAEPLATHEVISVETGETRRIVAVRVPHRLSEDDLARIASGLRKSDEPQGRRTLVNFYLPGKRLTDASWASASFAPQLKITVNGLTLDEETALRAAAESEKRANVGMWLTEAPAAPGLLVIYRDKGHTFADWRLRGGHRTIEEVAESRGQHGRRFDIVGDQNQHYVLVSGGALELREKTGLIAVAEPVKPAAAALARKDEAAKPATSAKPAAIATGAAPAHGTPPDAMPMPQAAAPAALMRPVASQTARTGAIAPGFTIVDSEAATSKPSAPPVVEGAAPPPAIAADTSAAAPLKKPHAVEKQPPPVKQAKAGKKIVKAHTKPNGNGPAAASHMQVKPAPPAAAPQQPYRIPADMASAARRYVN